MDTAVVNVKIDKKTKKEAQKVAEELGFSLSALVKAYLKQLIRTRKVDFNAYGEEEPSEYLLKTLKQSEEDIRKGRVSPDFTNVDDMIAWLDDPNRKYAYQIHKKVRKAVRKS